MATGCGERGGRHGAPAPATRVARRGAAMVCWAWPTRAVGPCAMGDRGNQCRTLTGRGRYAGTIEEEKTSHGLAHRLHRPPRAPLPRLGIRRHPAGTAVSALQPQTPENLTLPN